MASSRVRAAVLLPILAQPLVLGCGAKAPLAPASHALAARSTERADRLVTRQASITISVESVTVAVGRMQEIAAAAEGLVAESSRTEDDSASFVLRVPAARLEATLDLIAALGRARDRTVSARDVTESVSDLAARLENKTALCARLRALLESAAAVQDAIAVEEQLSRVQTEIDLLEAQMRRLESDVAMATVSAKLEERRRLGPVGLVLRGVYSAVRRLFVWK